MRHFFKITLVAIFLFTGASSFAQSFKFGHIDSNKLLSIMPEKDQAQKQIQAKAAEYDKQIKEMRTEYETLINNYVAVRETLSEAVRQTRKPKFRICRIACKLLMDLLNRSFRKLKMSC